MSSDGTPTLPFHSGGKAARAFPGVGDQFDIAAQSDFFYNVWEDNFIGDAIRVEYPAAKTSTGTATFTTDNIHGFLELKSGSANNGYAGQGVGLHWNGDRGTLAEFLVETPASLADWKCEVGITSSVGDAGAVDSKNGVTATASNFAVLVYDSNDDGTLQLIHKKGGGTVYAVDPSFNLAVSTVYYMAVRAVGDNVFAMVRGLSGTESAVITFGNLVADAGTEGATAMTPWAFAQSRTTTGQTLKLHKWRVTEPAW